jgi:hypothetical protein
VETEGDFYTVDEAAKVLERTPGRIRQMLRDGTRAWVKDQNVLIENNNFTGYKVNLAITFVLEEGEQPA